MKRPIACLLLLTSLTAHANDLDDQVRQAAEQVMREQRIPGLAIGLTVDGQSHFYSFGVGEAGGQAVSPDTLFEVGSVSKTFTATLAAYAQARGKLDLREPVARYLPEYTGSPFGQVSLLGLATHTAGGFPLQVPDSVADNRQLGDWLKAWKPQYPEGAQRSYANPSIGMLGVVSAKALGVPFRSAMEQQLFPRLGLNNTWIEVPAGKQAGYAWGYDKADAKVRVSPGVLADEAYGVKTSARDLLRFVQVNLGEPLADPALQAAVNATHTGYFDTGYFTQDLIWEQFPNPPTLQTMLDGTDNRWALASQPVKALTPAQAPRGDVWVNKTGSTNGFGAYVAFVPEKRAGIVILANRNYPNAERVKLAYRILAEAAPD